jgi:hypothetical protein
MHGHALPLPIRPYVLRVLGSKRPSGAPALQTVIRSRRLTCSSDGSGVQDRLNGKERLAALGQVEQAQATLEEARAAYAALARVLGISSVVSAARVPPASLYGCSPHEKSLSSRTEPPTFV